MRILMVHPHDIHSSVEPWTRRVKSLAEEFAKSGHEVRLVYFPLKKRDPTNSSNNLYEEFVFNRNCSFTNFIKNTVKLIKLAEWSDVMHFQKCHHYASIPTVIAAYIKKKPLHYDWDDWEEMIWYESCGRGLHSLFIGFSFRILERFLPVFADSVSVASHHLRTLALKYGVNEDRICLAPVGVDSKEFNPSVASGNIKDNYNIKGNLVLYVGQLHGAQYIELLIKAAKSVLEQRKDTTFMIVGEGVMERDLRILTRDLGIDDKVIFTGSVSHGQIPAYINAADVCVAPFRDTLVTRCKSPLKIVEYCSCAKAIVASNVGEVRRMLGGVAVLVEPGNFQALSEGILRLLNEKQLRANLGKFARLRVEKHYNWANTAGAIFSLYQRICIK